MNIPMINMINIIHIDVICCYKVINIIMMNDSKSVQSIPTIKPLRKPHTLTLQWSPCWGSDTRIQSPRGNGHVAGDLVIHGEVWTSSGHGNGRSPINGGLIGKSQISIVPFPLPRLMKPEGTVDPRHGKVSIWPRSRHLWKAWSTPLPRS